MALTTFRPGAMRDLAARIHSRDPSRDALRRALRAALVIPAVTVLGYLLAGPSQVTAFTMVGSIALLVVADFPGSIGTRAAAYTGLAINGTVLITLATLAAPHPWISLPLCFAVGTLVSVLGLLSELIAAGQRATLMIFLIAVCAPPGALPGRLLGWLLALLVCVPAALFLFPQRHTTELRHLAAQVCTALADRLEGGRRHEESTAEQLSTTLAALNAEFRGVAFRPIAMTAGSRSLIRLVSNLRWLGDRVGPDSAELLGPIAPFSVAVLRGSADALESADRPGADRLAALMATHRTIAFRQFDNDIHEILAEPNDDHAVARGRTLLDRRTMSATIALTGRIITAATLADTRSPIDKMFGRGLPETGIADRVHTRRSAVAVLFGYLATRSVTVRNSLRTGLALALAVGVTLVLPVQNGVWVALGALSVLRSSAATTRTSVVSALTGTVIGFAIGSTIIAIVGVRPLTLLSLLPLAAFGSTYVLKVGSFTASQAMFTMQVLIVFNMIRPVGWQIGLIRIEDVVLGGVVGLVVSALMWPGGARTAVQRAIDNAVVACSWYLDAAVTRVTQGASPETDAAVASLGSAALTAARTHGDAVRVYLAETSGTTDIAQIESAERIPRLRTAADLIADVPPPPPGTFPLTRNILEHYTAALCTCIEQVHEPASLPDISDEFIPALRAEAMFAAEPAKAALPLVTVAATIGELQSTYPAGSEPESLDA